MSIIIFSQTAVKVGKQAPEIRKLRVNTHVDAKGVAIEAAWRDTTAPDGTLIIDAVETLKAQGYTVVEDKRPELIVGTKHFTTRIIRLTKADAPVEEAPEPKKAARPRKPRRGAQRSTPARSAPVGAGGRGAQRSTPARSAPVGAGGRGKKNVEQMEEQLA